MLAIFYICEVKSDMQENVFIDTKSISFSDRESFNNTILLLTMVKSEYYYIIGFSRTAGKITVGFDFETKTEGKITRELTIDFKSSETEIIIHSDVIELSEERISSYYANNLEKRFSTKGHTLCYDDRIPKDDLFPSTVKEMNAALMEARKIMGKMLIL